MDVGKSFKWNGLVEIDLHVIQSRMKSADKAKAKPDMKWATSYNIDQPMVLDSNHEVWTNVESLPHWTFTKEIFKIYKLTFVNKQLHHHQCDHEHHHHQHQHQQQPMYYLPPKHYIVWVTKHLQTILDCSLEGGGG